MCLHDWKWKSSSPVLADGGCRSGCIHWDNLTEIVQYLFILKRVFGQDFNKWGGHVGIDVQFKDTSAAWDIHPLGRCLILLPFASCTRRILQQAWCVHLTCPDTSSPCSLRADSWWRPGPSGRRWWARSLIATTSLWIIDARLAKWSD